MGRASDGVGEEVLDWRLECQSVILGAVAVDRAVLEEVGLGSTVLLTPNWSPGALTGVVVGVG